jgi:hypothetical protein
MWPWTCVLTSLAYNNYKNSHYVFAFFVLEETIDDESGLLSTKSFFRCLWKWKTDTYFKIIEFIPRWSSVQCESYTYRPWVSSLFLSFVSIDSTMSFWSSLVSQVDEKTQQIIVIECFRCSDTFLILAAHYLHDLFLESKDFKFLKDAVCLLEYAYHVSPSNHHFKLLLLKFYNMLGNVLMFSMIQMFHHFSRSL